MPAIPEVGFSGGNSAGFTLVMIVVFFFIFMAAKKQLNDWFNIEINLITSGIGAAACIPATYFFDIRIGFISGLVGLVIGIVVGMFFQEGGFSFEGGGE